MLSGAGLLGKEILGRSSENKTRYLLSAEDKPAMTTPGYRSMSWCKNDFISTHMKQPETWRRSGSHLDAVDLKKAFRLDILSERETDCRVQSRSSRLANNAWSWIKLWCISISWTTSSQPPRPGLKSSHRTIVLISLFEATNRENLCAPGVQKQRLVKRMRHFLRNWIGLVAYPAHTEWQNCQLDSGEVSIETSNVHQL